MDRMTKFITQKTIWFKINKILIDSTTEFTYYTENKMLGCSDKILYLVDSTKLFGCFNQIGIFGRLNQKIYFSQPKFV